MIIKIPLILLTVKICINYHSFGSVGKISCERSFANRRYLRKGKNSAFHSKTGIWPVRVDWKNFIVLSSNTIYYSIIFASRFKNAEYIASSQTKLNVKHLRSDCSHIPATSANTKPTA
jgi:hypothetical protein